MDALGARVSKIVEERLNDNDKGAVSPRVLSRCDRDRFDRLDAVSREQFAHADALLTRDIDTVRTYATCVASASRIAARIGALAPVQG